MNGPDDRRQRRSEVAPAHDLRQGGRIAIFRQGFQAIAEIGMTRGEERAAHHHLVVHHHVLRFHQPGDRRDRRGEHRIARDVLDAHSEFAHIARGERDGNDVGRGRVGEAVIQVADQLHHAHFVGAGIRSRLTRGLFIALANRLIDLAAGIPEINLIADVAADGVAISVKEGDPRFVRREEQVVRLRQHGSEGQGIAGFGLDDKLVGAAGQGRSRAIAADRDRRDAGIIEQADARDILDGDGEGSPIRGDPPERRR